jgi:hypothetical protein
MRNGFIVATVCVALGIAAAAQAQFVSPVHLVPVVAKTAGAAGTDWMTSMAISNVSASPAPMMALFFKEKQANSLFGVPTHQFTVGAGQTITVQDVLGTWFPQQGNTKGALLLLPSDGGEEGPNLAVMTRIFNNANPAATYGQAIPSSFVNLIIGRGTAVLTGARQDGAFRSNVGVVNISLTTISVIITTYNASGAQVAQVTKSVEPLSLRQYSMSELGVTTLAPAGRVEVTVDPATITWDPCDQDPTGLASAFAMFMSYISRVDQSTGDSEFALGLADWEEYVAECGEEPNDCP